MSAENRSMDCRAGDGALTLSPNAAMRLRLAIEQVEPLLASGQAEQALPHLVSLLSHLRALSPLLH